MIIVNAFGACRSAAAKNEAAIARLMHKASKAEGLKPTPARQSNYGNVGYTQEQADQMHRRWLEIAKMIRAYLKDHKGASTVDIRTALGVNRTTASAWMTKMRMNPEMFGITVKVSKDTKRYAYWRTEDL